MSNLENLPKRTNNIQRKRQIRDLTDINNNITQTRKTINKRLIFNGIPRMGSSRSEANNKMMFCQFKSVHIYYLNNAEGRLTHPLRHRGRRHLHQFFFPYADKQDEMKEVRNSGFACKKIVVTTQRLLIF